MSAPNAKRNFLFWLVAGIAAIALAWQLDNRVDAALSVTGRPFLKNLAWWCSKIGEGWVVALWGILCAAIFFLMKRPEVAAKIFFVALTSEIAGLAAIVVRAFVGRTRPHAKMPQGIYGIWHDGHWIAGKYDFSSFPSGHSAVAAGLAAAAWLFNPRWGAVAAIYAFAVMWSRIAQESHHLSDVVGSIVLSIPIAVLMKKHFAPVNEIFFEKLADGLKNRREKNFKGGSDGGEHSLMQLADEHWTGTPKEMHKRADTIMRGFASATHPDLGEVKFTSDGRGKTLFDKRTPHEFQSIQALPKLIEHGRLVSSEPDRGGKENVVAFHKLEHGLQIGDQEYRAEIIVKETVAGAKTVQKFYLHRLHKKKPAILAV